MEFFKQNTKINFMGQRKWAALLSTILFLLSISSLAINGLNWGLDFTGGTQLQLSFANQANINDLRNRLQEAGFREPTVVSYGNSREVLVSLAPENQDHNTTSIVSDMAKEAVTHKVLQVLPEAKIEQVDYIGPQVGSELATKGLLAIVVALLGTMVYIAFRFEFRFAVGSTIALIHDPIIIMGIFSYFHIEFNLIALAAVLTVIGYSLNDTIVIFDRVRENFRKLRKATPIEVVNQAINQTLSRTIMTSVLTLIVVLALFFLAGSMLHAFSLALIIGIVVGTYSSIYVAGSLSLALGLNRLHLLPVKTEVDDRP